MSILSDFISAVSPIAQAVIGTNTVAIAGGSAIAFTPGEERYARDYETGGFEQESTTDIVILKSIFSPAYPAEISTYEGKVAVIGGKNWRIRSLTDGVSFISIGLVSTNKSA